MNLIGTLGSWWGYAEADATIVGVLVAAVVALAVAYVAMRVVRSRRPAGSTDPEQLGRGGKRGG